MNSRLRALSVKTSRGHGKPCPYNCNSYDIVKIQYARAKGECGRAHQHLNLPTIALGVSHFPLSQSSSVPLSLAGVAFALVGDFLVEWLGVDHDVEVG
ncbi:hypothetical protein IAD21_01957 [Abditibacteriota bacterium]|nr:hypothetical protein IAD21_01957 [Abditibacteriota bacterium]